jgi:uncharacterized protein
MAWNSLVLCNRTCCRLLFFALGIISGLIKSDLVIPEQLSKFFSVYIMLAIGFKGGVTLAETAHIDTKMMLTISSGIMIGLLQPFLGFFF